MRAAIVAGLAALLASCAPLPAPAAGVSPDSLPMFDEIRQRVVPVALYGAEEGRAKPLALLSHGYGGRNSDYRFLAEALAARGYLVASVQHELAGDPPMPTQGDPAVVRRPFWERGVQNLLFVAGELEARGLADPSRGLLLAGHSNGGDTSALFAVEHTEAAAIVFTLDNRRTALPRTARPRICSARSSDQRPDPGILPDAAEQRTFNMVIETVPVIHDDMSDVATPEQKQAILAVLDRCLAGERGIR